MKSAPENDSLTRSEDSDLIEQAARLHWDDTTKMVDVVGVLEAMADKVCALTYDCLANFAWSLACDD